MLSHKEPRLAPKLSLAGSKNISNQVNTVKMMTKKDRKVSYNEPRPSQKKQREDNVQVGRMFQG